MDRLEKLSRLALVRGLPDLMKGEKLRSGREKNLFARMTREADRELKKYRTSESDIDTLRRRFDRFAALTGWDVKARNVRTYLSFLCLISEPWPRIERAVLDLVEFHERKMPESRRTLCDHAGLRAYEIWEGLNR